MADSTKIVKAPVGGRAFPEAKKVSSHNLEYARMFAAAWPERPIVQEAPAQLGCCLHATLIQVPLKVVDAELVIATKVIHARPETEIMKSAKEGAKLDAPIAASLKEIEYGR